MSNSEDNGWAKIAITSILTAALTAFGTMFVGTLGYFNQDRSHDIDMVKIALSILQGENKDTSLQGRKFALRTLAKYSDIAIPEDEFDSWSENGTIHLPGLLIEGINPPAGPFGGICTLEEVLKGVPAIECADVIAKNQMFRAWVGSLPSSPDTNPHPN